MMSSEESGEDLADLTIQIDDDVEDVDAEDEVMEESETVAAPRRGGNEIRPPANVARKSYENNETWLGAGLIPSEKKLQERAARFGITTSAPKRLTEETVDKLYDSCQIPMEDREVSSLLEDWPSSADDPESLKTRPRYRLNVLHCRGTDEMSTEDVFAYFSTYAPLSIEWINDTSCNVVYEDRLAAARALANMSRGLLSEKAKRTSSSSLVRANGDGDEVVEASADVEMDVEEGEIEEDSADIVILPGEKLIHPKDVDVAVPLGHVWRLGAPSRQAKAIIMRFATVDDKKPPKAEKQSRYYRKYGNPNFEGMTGIITESRKRRFFEESRSKWGGGRGRRRPGVSPLDRIATVAAAAAAATGAVGEAAASNKKNPWGALAATWHEEWRAQDAPHTPPAPPPSTHSPKSSVRDADSDLNLSFSDSSDSDDSDDVVEWQSRNKRPRMRMYADDVETANKFKQKLQRRTRAKVGHEPRPVGVMAADLEEQASRPRSVSPPVLRRSRTMDGDEPRPRSRRLNHRHELDDFMTDLRRRLSQNTKDDEEVNEANFTNGSRLEKESIRITIDNTETADRRRDRDGDRDRDRRRETSDTDDDETDEEYEAPRRSTRRQRRRSDEASLRSRLRRRPVYARDDDEDSDEVVARRDVPDLREKLRQKRGEANDGPKKTGEFSPLRIEVDNDEYYGIIGSESDE